MTALKAIWQRMTGMSLGWKAWISAQVFIISSLIFDLPHLFGWLGTAPLGFAIYRLMLVEE